MAITGCDGAMASNGDDNGCDAGGDIPASAIIVLAADGAGIDAGGPCAGIDVSGPSIGPPCPGIDVGGPPIGPPGIDVGGPPVGPPSCAGMISGALVGDVIDAAGALIEGEAPIGPLSGAEGGPPICESIGAGGSPIGADAVAACDTRSPTVNPQRAQNLACGGLIAPHWAHGAPSNGGGGEACGLVCGILDFAGPTPGDVAIRFASIRASSASENARWRSTTMVSNGSGSSTMGGGGGAIGSS